MTCLITHPTLTVTTLWCGNHHEPCLKSEGTERSHEYETAPTVVQIASLQSLHVDPPVPLSSKLRDRWVSSYCLHARPATQLSWFSIFSPTPCHDFGGQGWITRCRFLAQVDPKFLILLPPLPECWDDPPRIELCQAVSIILLFISPKECMSDPSYSERNARCVPATLTTRAHF